jgi:hypothetical protein
MSTYDIKVFSFTTQLSRRVKQDAVSGAVGALPVGAAEGDLLAGLHDTVEIRLRGLLGRAFHEAPREAVQAERRRSIAHRFGDPVLKRGHGGYIERTPAAKQTCPGKTPTPSGLAAN